MNSRPQNAFTLVELLTVIAIIAILMGLLFPAIGAIKEQARKTQAKQDCMGIVAAVKAYFTEYGKYPPIGTTAPTTDQTFGYNLGDNATIFDTLRSIDSSKMGTSGVNSNYVMNPRRIVFFEGKSVSNPATPKAGFATDGNFYDPWGSKYGITIDYDYSNDIAVPYTDFSGTSKTPQLGCGAFSMGKDQILGSTGATNMYRNGTTLSDDVISWQ